MSALQRSYFAPRAPAAIVVRTRTAPAKRRRSHRRRRSSGSVGGVLGNNTIQYAIGGALYGFAVKQGLVAKLPAIPVIGRTGTAAILLNYWAGHGGGDMVRKAATAAACIAGYQLGAEGHVTGDDMSGDSYADGDYADGLTTMGDMDGLDTAGDDV
jgi:hypothetical protein